MFTSERLHEGQIYTREHLREQFQITDKTLDTGILRPAGHDSIWLFNTEQKSPDRTQYIDHLDGYMLSLAGANAWAQRSVIINHKAKRKVWEKDGVETPGHSISNFGKPAQLIL